VSIAIRICVSLVLCTSLSLACSTTGRKRVDAANSSISRFRSDLLSAQKQIELIDSTLGGISQSTGPQLEQAFAAFGKELEKLLSQAEDVRKRADAMETSGEKYFTAWEEEAQQMGSATIQRAATERRTQLLATYTALSSSMDATGAAYRPYESSLGDIKRFLDNDLTPSGVNAIASEIQEARQQGRTAHAHINRVLQRSAEVKQALSPGAG